MAASTSAARRPCACLTYTRAAAGAHPRCIHKAAPPAPRAGVCRGLPFHRRRPRRDARAPCSSSRTDLRCGASRCAVRGGGMGVYGELRRPRWTVRHPPGRRGPRTAYNCAAIKPPTTSPDEVRGLAVRYARCAQGPCDGESSSSTRTRPWSTATTTSSSRAVGVRQRRPLTTRTRTSTVYNAPTSPTLQRAADRGHRPGSPSSRARRRRQASALGDGRDGAPEQVDGAPLGDPHATSCTYPSGASASVLINNARLSGYAPGARRTTTRSTRRASSAAAPRPSPWHLEKAKRVIDIDLALPRRQQEEERRRPEQRHRRAHRDPRGRPRPLVVAFVAYIVMKEKAGEPLFMEVTTKTPLQDHAVSALPPPR